MHITKESLSTMSLEDLRAERTRQMAIWKNAWEAADMCSQAIADRIAEFNVSDFVVDSSGATWQVTRIVGWKWSSGVQVKYRGRRIKKDGSAGAVESEIYRLPLRAANSGNDGGTD
ncbi:MAG: hypothetical protein ACYCS8_00530 [Acidithiobacillus sp.]